MLAEKNIYNNSAYRRLQAISQDDGKRMEYEARQKAIRNYNEGLLEAEERGEKRGILGTISSLWDFGHSIGVNGRSMEDTYFDGDKVLVEKTQDVPIGKIGIFIRGNECFIKEVGENRLISHNENKEQYPDIIPYERRIDTIGIVLGKVGE